MEIIGNVLKRTPKEKKTETFEVQEFIVDCSYVDNYTQQKRENFLPFQITNKNIEKLEAIPDGARVKIFFAPQGRIFTKQDGSEGCACNLNAFKFEVISTPQTNTNGSPAQTYP